MESALCLKIFVVVSLSSSILQPQPLRVICSSGAFSVIQVHVSWIQTLLSFLIFYLFIFRERGREREREREKHQCVVASHTPPTGGTTWVATQACAMTGNRTGDPLVHGLVLNPLSHTSQGKSSDSCQPTIDTIIQATITHAWISVSAWLLTAVPDSHLSLYSLQNYSPARITLLKCKPDHVSPVQNLLMASHRFQVKTVCWSVTASPWTSFSHSGLFFLLIIESALGKPPTCLEPLSTTVNVKKKVSFPLPTSLSGLLRASHTFIYFHCWFLLL